MCSSWSRTRILALEDGEKCRRRFGGREDSRAAIVSLGFSSTFLGESSEGLLQSFFRIVMSCRAFSELPTAH